MKLSWKAKFNHLRAIAKIRNEWQQEIFSQMLRLVQQANQGVTIQSMIVRRMEMPVDPKKLTQLTGIVSNMEEIPVDQKTLDDLGFAMKSPPKGAKTTVEPLKVQMVVGGVTLLECALQTLE